MWKTILAHPFVTGLVSLAVAVGTLVAFLAALAAIWTVLSRDTVPEFLTKHGWLVTFPSWQAILVLVVSMAVLGCQIAILKEAYSQPTPSDPTVNKVTVYGHDAAFAKNPAIYESVKNMFRDAGWTMTIARTNVTRHATGVWLHGGSDVERRVAEWGLKTLGVTPQIDYQNDNPPNLQVIVGKYEATQEAPRVSLESEIAIFKNERDGMEQAWLTCKKEFAIWRLHEFVQQVRKNIDNHNAGKPDSDKVPLPHVTIRFVGYSANDSGLAVRIKKLLQEHAAGWTVTLDGGNNPALMPDRDFKVVFVNPWANTYAEVADACSRGCLLGDVAVGVRLDQNEFDTGKLVIEVLPQTNA